MKKILIGFFIGIVGCVIAFFIYNTVTQAKINGKWYLYTGSNINTESALADQLNAKDYIEFSSDTMNEYTSDGKDGICTYEIKGNTMFAGDAIFNFTITKVGEYKVLFLRVIGSNMGNEEKYFNGGESYTYVYEYF